MGDRSLSAPPGLRVFQFTLLIWLASGPSAAGPSAVGIDSVTRTVSTAGGKHFGISVAAGYRLNAADNVIASIEGSAGVSPEDSSAKDRKREVSYAHSWFENVIDEMLG